MGTQWAPEQFSLPSPVQALLVPSLRHRMLVSVLQAGLCCLYWTDLHPQLLNGSALVVTRPSSATGQILPVSHFLEFSQTLNRISQIMRDFFSHGLGFPLLYLF